MEILFYSSGRSEIGRTLQESVEVLPFVDQMDSYHNLAALAGRFASPKALPGVIVLLALDGQEMDAFFDFRLRLKNGFLILVLPDSDESTVVRSYQLYPRFITYQDSDFSDIQSVLKRIQKWDQVYLEWEEQKSVESTCSLGKSNALQGVE